MSASHEARSGAADPAAPALVRRFPALAERLPWLPLARLPTPVEPLALEGFGEDAWIKRDDLSGAPYGGNKVRKLEWVLAEARRQGAERLITMGAAGSHHALATTAYGRRLGFEVTTVLFPQPLTPHVREVLLLQHGLGAELRFAPRMEALPLLALAHRRQRCFAVAPGGSDARGTLGYVSAALELAEQVRTGLLPEPETAHLAVGTMGTAVGLAIGFDLAGLGTRISAVRITGRLVTNRWTLRRLVRRTLALLAAAGMEPPAAERVLRRIDVRHDQIGRGYGHETAAGSRAAERFAAAGLALDPTYTAKAAAGFLDAVGTRPGRPQLFWHTLSACEPPLPPGCPDLHTLPAPFRRYLGNRGARG
jgi:1-aminocyclopropane-1-carboxylate deaminase/D-cysteine desulfhydrase-like pyridoxal-dependent ACC family enzyme